MEKILELDFPNSEINHKKDKIIGALLFGAIGDAFGWPNEFKKRSVPTEREFISWKKLIGGRYWGYWMDIQAGEYSDDTQLSLSVARSIKQDGTFDYNYLAFEEFPNWLTYQRGGGKTIKNSIRKLLRIALKLDPFKNFYQIKEKKEIFDYRDAGANGSAMRIMPVSLATINHRANILFKNCWRNTILTHGHPRAILGTLIYAFLIRYLISKQDFSLSEIKDYLNVVIDKSLISIKDDSEIQTWIKIWNQGRLILFEKVFEQIKHEAKDYLMKIFTFQNENPKKFFTYTRALNEFKGSGLSTVFCALYLFNKYLENPEEGIIEAANFIGSDTDTISYFLGGLFGAYYGSKSIPERFINKLQDREYIQNIGIYLWKVATNSFLNDAENSSPLVVQSKNEKKYSIISHLSIWDEELRDMIYDFSEGNRIIHPLFGKGIIMSSNIIPTQKPDYFAKIIKVKFESGLNCYFSTRFKKGDQRSFDENYIVELAYLLKNFNR